METKRQRTRVLLRAVIGTGSANHRRLELSDGSETSDSSFVKEPEIMNSVGMHYDHTPRPKTAQATIGRAASQQPLRSKKRGKSAPKVRFSVSGPLNASVDSSVPLPPSIPASSPPLTSPPTSASSPPPSGTFAHSSMSVPSTSTPLKPVPLPKARERSSSSASEVDGVAVGDINMPANSTSLLEMRGHSSSSASEVDGVAVRITHATATSTPLLLDARGKDDDINYSSSSTSDASDIRGIHGTRGAVTSTPLLHKLSEEGDVITHVHSGVKKNASSRVNNALTPHCKSSIVISSEVTPKVKKKRHKVLVQKPSSCNSSMDSLRSPRSGEGNPPPPHESRRHSKRTRSSLLKRGRNQVYPEPQELSDEEPVDRPSPTFKEASPSSTNTASADKNASLSESTRCSVSSLTPLLVSDLRMRGNRAASEFGCEVQLESCFPDRHIRVYVVTWNMQEKKDLPETLDDLLLPQNHDIAADVFVVGTQESTPSRKEWEVLLQKTLGPLYVLVQSSSLGVIYVSFFIRRDLIWFCSATSSATYATRPVTIIKTKGAVALSFTLFGSSFLFITSHLTASRHKIAERNTDVHKISTNLALSDNIATGGLSGDVTTKFDYVFWFGDLNYRVDMDRHAANKCLAKSDIRSLLLKDQLTREILQGHVFPGFSEQPILFSPSYKFDVFSNKYDTSEKQRVPSWTDRILFKSRSGDGIVGCGYTSCHSIKCSDHRPVCAVFRVRLEPCHHVGGIPGSVASYDREVYIRANKQRSIVMSMTRASEAMVGRHSSASSIRRGTSERKQAVISQYCSIM